MLGQVGHGQTVHAEVLQHGVGQPPLRLAARYHVCQVEVELVVVQDLSNVVIIYLGDVSSPTSPEPTSYLYSLSPGLLAPVSVARVDLMGDTPGTSSAADTGNPDPDRKIFTLPKHH